MAFLVNYSNEVITSTANCPFSRCNMTATPRYFTLSMRIGLFGFSQRPLPLPLPLLVLLSSVKKVPIVLADTAGLFSDLYYAGLCFGHFQRVLHWHFWASAAHAYLQMSPNASLGYVYCYIEYKASSCSTTLIGDPPQAGEALSLLHYQVKTFTDRNFGKTGHSTRLWLLLQKKKPFLEWSSNFLPWGST